MQTQTTTSIKIHWSFLVFVAVISFVFYYGCNYQKALETTDNKHFIKKIDSLQNIIINYETQLHEERQKRLHLYAQKDSLQNIITNNAIYLPDLQRLKRTK